MALGLISNDLGVRREGVFIIAYALRNGHARKAPASEERACAYIRNAVGNFDARKAQASRKRAIAYARHAIGYSDFGKATAIGECFLPYA